ncbi:bifunctional aminoglycoside phosphotransferase/ATP-binding protein [Methylobacterium sp. NEAU K]|uniref:bifunctional aminoglycoside phosphotransferase/ATP-binding protein n=1 Tax=Methylobacterium sp. NEAU K TaxID=3064946 RepID=UPI002735B1F2|nr:bifunctional aminoglycoside phosphotransferase/ATP-binding protein [Methylobacterium sp. NEAU K]MDP4003306.1 AAA family ATPase [Methylobacterium sp. NEAU K]
MPPESQNAVTTFLTDALSDEGPVETVSTHISNLFLARDRVFKVKRAVRFPYLDFSTPRRRLAACAEEVALNSRTAPALYLGARRITREPNGSLTFDGAGDLVDAVVEMRRFPEADLFDAMARDGRLGPDHIADLAHRIAVFHEGAEVSRDHGGAAAMAALLDMNDAALRTSTLVSAGEAEALAARFRAALGRHGRLLDARRAAGKVRRCHGDLTLRNICLFEGKATPFDCIEFSETIATIDVLYDLAFVLMDLWHRARFDLANLLFNRYLDVADETDGIGLLPFLMAVRAAIRAHVTATQAADAADVTAAARIAEAHAYFDLAGRLLADRPVRLLAVGGFSGSGKSSVAAVAAPWIGAAPGARILASDRIRKRLHGVGALTRLPASAYDPATSERVYATLRQEAGRALSAGHCAVADAVFDRPEERTAIEAIARERGIPFCGVWLEAPAATLAGRVDRRVDDPSDATAAVSAAQVARGCGPLAWHRLAADRPLDALRASVLSLCGSLGATETLAAPSIGAGPPFP